MVSYLMPKMKEVVTMNLDAVRRKLKTGTKSCFFELFGYDFIIDGDFGVWLIEVNTNPCIEESSSLLCRYLPRMLNDMLKLTVDQVFSAKKNIAPIDLNKFPIDGY